MKHKTIFALFLLSAVVNGWVATLQPVLLSLGAALALLNLDVDFVSDIEPIAERKWLRKKKEDTEKLILDKNLGSLVDEMYKLKKKDKNKKVLERMEGENLKKFKEAMLEDYKNTLEKEFGKVEELTEDEKKYKEHMLKYMAKVEKAENILEVATILEDAIDFSKKGK